MSEILKSIKHSSSSRIMSKIRKNNPGLLALTETGLKSPGNKFWQDGGGYDRNIWTPDAIYAEIEYIHNNPVRKGLAENQGDWEWSSAHICSGKEDGIIKLDLEVLKGL